MYTAVYCNMPCSYIAPFQAGQLGRDICPLGLGSNVLLGHTSLSHLGSCGLVPSTAELGGRYVGCGKLLMLKLVEALWDLQQITGHLSISSEWGTGSCNFQCCFLSNLVTTKTPKQCSSTWVAVFSQALTLVESI